MEKSYCLKRILFFTFCSIASFQLTLAEKNTKRLPVYRETIEVDAQEFPLLDSRSDSSTLKTYYAGIWDDQMVMLTRDTLSRKMPFVLHVSSMKEGRKKWLDIPLALPLNSTLSTIKLTPKGLLCLPNIVPEKQLTPFFIIKEGDKYAVKTFATLPDSLQAFDIQLYNQKTFLIGSSDSYCTLYELNASEKSWNRLKTWKWRQPCSWCSQIQNDGVEKCLFVFYSNGSKECIKYNFRTKDFDRKLLPQAFPKISGLQTDAISLNHIALLNDSSLYIYHTLSNTVIKRPEINTATMQVYSICETDDRLMLVGQSKTSQEPQLLSLKFVKVKKHFTLIDILVIVIYFLILTGIGFFFSKRQKNSDDYFKGGGRIPWWAAGLSLFGTALSAITFMAIPAKSFATDWSYMLFNLGIILVAPIIVFVFIPYYRKLNITTAYQYLEIRFNAIIRIICSLSFIIFQIGRMGIVLYLPAIALNVVTGFNIFLCIALMGFVSVLYTMIGGIEAVVWTDALQVVILLGGALFSIIHIFLQLPTGFMDTLSLASADGKFFLGETGFDLTNPTVWTVLIATCFTNLTTYGTDQSMVQRYLTTSSQKAAQKSVWSNAILTIPATVIFFFIGTLLYLYYKTYPTELSVSVKSGDSIFPWYIFNNLPVGIAGLLISGIFAAAMSTLSGSMNSAATAFTVDIRPRIFGKHSNPVKQLREARVATFIIGFTSLIFSFWMASSSITSLWDEFNKILGLILGSMGGLFLLGMLTKRANASGALIGMIGSVIVQLFVAHFQTFHLLLYTTSGFISCFVIGYVASLFFKRNEQKI